MEKNMIPCLRENENGIETLYVDGRPFLILGGELHNSSSSSPVYMEERVWPCLRALHLNTVLLAVAWESIEPREGLFDFSLVEAVLKQARREGVRLVLLWFGLWKNGESFYVPGWVKEDCNRFFRAVHQNGFASDTVSPFCEVAVEKDRCAFTALMGYLKEHDEGHTVIMVQVENETGFLKSDRDYSHAANMKFNEELPENVRILYGQEGTWAEVFGENAGEYFMAYYYACAVEKIAASGKRVLPLPMYVNAWLEQHPDRAGVYPSGGPVAKLINLWRIAAPSIDMVSPDIYLPDFKGECEKYHIAGNSLFIPEACKNAVTSSNALYAFAAHNAIGYSPFGIEDILYDHGQEMDKSQLQALNITSDAFYDRETAPYLTRSYEILYGLWEKLLECRGTDRMIGFIQGHPYESGCIIPLKKFDLQLDYLCGSPRGTGSAGIIFPEDNGFYIVGCNVRFSVLPKPGSGVCMGIPGYEEGGFVNGEWVKMRVLNGDEVYDMSLKDMPQARYVRVYARRQ